MVGQEDRNAPSPLDILQAENARLREELAKEREKVERQRQQLEDYALANIQDRQELAAAQKDAARYRWLRDSEIDRYIDIATWDGEHWSAWYGGSAELDAAIDIAIEQENEK